MTARCRSPAQRYGRPAFLRATGLHRQRRSRTRKTHPSGPSEPLAPSRSRGTVKVACRRWTRGTGRFLTQQESMPEARLLWPWPALHSACTHFGGLSSASGFHGVVWKPAQCGRAFVRLSARLSQAPEMRRLPSSAGFGCFPARHTPPQSAPSAIVWNTNISTSSVSSRRLTGAASQSRGCA